MKRQFPSASTSKALASALATAAFLSLAPTGAGAAERAGDVAFTSGGVSLGARQALLAEAGQYNLHLEFAAAPEGEYLSDVDVDVVDARGRNVLSTRTQGPWLMAKLPAGNYGITARYGGTTRSQSVVVGQGRRHAVIRFPALNEQVVGVR